MAGIYSMFKISIFCGFLLIFVGCANTSKESISDTYAPPISSLKPGEYSKEIEKYHEIIKRDLQSNIQQHAHLYLANLYSSPLNPDRNYILARKHLETYALLDPDFTKVVDSRILLAALIEIERLSTLADVQTKKMLALSQELGNLKKRAATLKRDYKYIEDENLWLEMRIGDLQNRIRSLEASNNKLHKTIEMLSTLDSRLEEKRKNFMNKGLTDDEKNKPPQAVKK